MISERSVILATYRRRALGDSVSKAPRWFVSNQCDILAFAFVMSGLQHSEDARLDEKGNSELREERFDKKCGRKKPML